MLSRNYFFSREINSIFFALISLEPLWVDNSFSLHSSTKKCNLFSPTCCQDRLESWEEDGKEKTLLILSSFLLFLQLSLSLYEFFLTFPPISLLFEQTRGSQAVRLAAIYLILPLFLCSITHLSYFSIKSVFLGSSRKIKCQAQTVRQTAVWLCGRKGKGKRCVFLVSAFKSGHKKTAHIYVRGLSTTFLC